MPNNISKSFEPAMRFGGLGGLFTMGGIYTYYLMGVEAFSNPSYGLILFGVLFLLNTGMAVGAGLLRKGELGGSLPFREAVGQTFVTLAIIVVCYHAFYFILLNVIDPTLVDKLADIRMEQLREMKESGKVEKETFEQQKAIAENSRLSFSDFFWLTLVFLALSFLYSLILSAFLRKEPEAG
jgi:hypothetical protein